MSTITVTSLTFAYEGTPDNVFEDVSFRFDTDWKLGFVGRNGRGKTTFLKLLMKEYPYRGKIDTPCSFSYFPFSEVNEQGSAVDAVDSVIPDYEFWELCREVNLLGLSEEKLFLPYLALSQGERIKILIAALFLCQNSFLLLDEPTNHLDAEGRETLQAYLKTKKGFLIVSHDRNLLDAVTDHTLSINRENIEIQKGNFSQWFENKELQDNFERSENEKLKKDISRYKEAARRTSTWSDKVEATKYGNGPVDRGFIGAKSAKMMKRAKSAESRFEKAAEQKTQLLRNIETIGSLKLSPLHFHKDTLVNISGLSIQYDDTPVLSEFDLQIKQGDRIALQGGNGSGKSSILKILAGEDIPHTGTVHVSSGLIISYISQDTSFLAGSLPEFAASTGVNRTLLTTILRNLGFERNHFENNLAEFSEGQKKKVLLAKSLCEAAHLYIWDEPLNYIDVLSRMQIEDVLLKYEPTMLFVEHDRFFSERIATSYCNL
ncbi:MAG: ABC-F type ribosomal protection protein [Clostridiales Family XIII bacterium]|jgi:lincosamide and streptogramin A transport system ATP-binding/permease protein|nr:ABC-F type ribosomal protection protein [Clostridiales Family XIII bacterium]